MKTPRKFFKSFITVLGIPYGLLLPLLVFVILAWKAVSRRIGEPQPAQTLLLTIALFSVLAVGVCYLLL